MYEMPTDLQYKDELRKERIRIEDELEMLTTKHSLFPDICSPMVLNIISLS